MFLYINKNFVKITLVQKSFTVTNFGLMPIIKVYFCQTKTKQYENMTKEQDHPHWEFFKLLDLETPLPTQLDHW